MAQKKKPLCKFGEKCYRKNPKHLEEYDHPTKEGEDDQPPKKKGKIDDYFTGNKEPKARENKKSKVEDLKDSAKAEAGAGAGNTSGYCRPDSSDDEDNSENQEESPSKDAVDSESEDMSPPPSPSDEKENIKQKFLVDMPNDFYLLWNFAKNLNTKKPTDAFLPELGLQLVGPYDVLAKKCVKKNKAGKRPNYLRHWRYYYDPPEFMTVIKGDDATQFHIGYFRDDPKEMPVFTASNSAKENSTITPRGENIFAALCWFIDDKIKKEKNDSAKDKIKKLKSDLTSWAGKHSLSLEMKTKAMKARDKLVVCKSFHGAGVVVPMDENEVGYRPVPETPGDLKKMFKKVVDAKTEVEKNKAFDPVMELIMLVQFANDECDYGEGLELGLDMFSYGGEVFHKTILNLLPLAYQLLGRHEYASIIKAHIKNRKHSADLSELD